MILTSSSLKTSFFTTSFIWELSLIYGWRVVVAFSSKCIRCVQTKGLMLLYFLVSNQMQFYAFLAQHVTYLLDHLWVGKKLPLDISATLSGRHTLILLVRALIQALVLLLYLAFKLYRIFKVRLVIVTCRHLCRIKYRAYVSSITF